MGVEISRPPEPPPIDKNEILFIGEGITGNSAVTMFALNHLTWEKMREKKKFLKRKTKHKKKYYPTLVTIAKLYAGEVEEAGFKNDYDDYDNVEEGELVEKEAFFDVDFSKVYKLDMTKTRNDQVRKETYRLFEFLDNVKIIHYSYDSYDDLKDFVEALLNTKEMKYSVQRIVINVKVIHYEDGSEETRYAKDEELLASLLLICQNLTHLSLNGHILTTPSIANALYLIFKDESYPPILEEIDLSECYLRFGFFNLFQRVLYQCVLDEVITRAMTFGNTYSVNDNPDHLEMEGVIEGNKFDNNVREKLEDIERQCSRIANKNSYMHYMVNEEGDFFYYS